MTGYTYRQRRLGRVEEELLDLLRDVERQGSKCGNCGAYQSTDLAKESAAKDIVVMIEQVRAWQVSPWAGE